MPKEPPVVYPWTFYVQIDGIFSKQFIHWLHISTDQKSLFEIVNLTWRGSVKLANITWRDCADCELDFKRFIQVNKQYIKKLCMVVSLTSGDLLKLVNLSSKDSLNSISRDLFKLVNITGDCARMWTWYWEIEESGL